MSPLTRSRYKAYPLGYVEDCDEPRTKLGVCFSIRLELVFCYAVPECIAGDFEEPAGFGDVAACALQRFLQHLFFHLVNREAEGQEGGLLGASIRFC